MSPHRPPSGSRRASRLGVATPQSPAQPEPPDAPASPQPGTPSAEASTSSPAASTSSADPGASAFSQVAKVFGSIVAPTTLFTALLYYFGWDHTYYLYNYFGVHSTVLGLSTTDYLMRSVDALFIPISVGATGSLLALWAHAEIRSRLPAGSRPRLVRVALPVMGTVGALLATTGLVSVFRGDVLAGYLYDTAAPLCLIAGVLLLTYANHMRRTYPGSKPVPTEATDSLPWARPAEWAVVFMLVAIGLFWGATNYSAGVGISRAHQILLELPSDPSTVVYSKTSLNLNVPGVRETQCRDRQGAYPFRYDGLVLILQSGNQYLFLPRQWKPATSSAILLPRSDTLRLEFSPSPSHDDAPTITC